jgi:hypothetical protein
MTMTIRRDRQSGHLGIAASLLSGLMWRWMSDEDIKWPAPECHLNPRLECPENSTSASPPPAISKPGLSGGGTLDWVR